QTANGAESSIVPSIARNFAAVRANASLSMPMTASPAAGVVIRSRTLPGQGAASCYRASLSRAAGAVDVTLDRIDAGAVTRLMRVSSAALSGLTEFQLDVMAIDGHIMMMVNGRLMLEVSDNTLATGGVGLYAKGANVGFRELLVSDLMGRD